MKIRQTFFRLISGSLAMALAVGVFTAVPAGRIPGASAEVIDAYGSIKYNTDKEMYVYETSDYEFCSVEKTDSAVRLTLRAGSWGTTDYCFDIYSYDEGALDALNSFSPGESVNITFESRYFYKYLNTVPNPASDWSAWDGTFENVYVDGTENPSWINYGSDYADPLLNPDLGFDPNKDEDPIQSDPDYLEYTQWGGFLTRNIYTVDKLLSVRRPGVHYYGDINDDTFVDTFDLLEYRQYISGSLSRKLSHDEFLNADINGDKQIDEEDMEQLSAFLLGKETEFNAVGEIGSLRLDNAVDVQRSEGKPVDEKFAEAQMKFGVDLLKASFDPAEKEKNILFSPFSITSALSMTANGADNNTLKELEDVLGGGKLTIDEINEYMSYFLSNLPDKTGEVLNVANSLWCKDMPGFKPFDSFLEANKKYYGSEIYKTAFDLDTVSDINNWVNKNTNGMIPKIADKDTFTEYTVLALLNALYFEMDWAKKYDNTVDGKFTDIDGKLRDIKELRSSEYLYYELEDADAFKKPYVNNDYYFVGIMPRDKDIVEYVKDLDGEKLASGLSTPFSSDEYDLDLQVMIPEFDYDYSAELSDALRKLGIKDAFKYGVADFSRLNDLTVDGSDKMYIESVIHKTKIEVSKTGTKAAAATMIGMAMGGMSTRKIRHVSIRLDKPFVYMIVDKNNVPIFVGAATQLGTD